MWVLYLNVLVIVTLSLLGVYSVAQEKMDLMMSSPTAWSCHYNPELEDDDLCKTAECAESFIALLNAITGTCVLYVLYVLCIGHGLCVALVYARKMCIYHTYHRDVKLSLDLRFGYVGDMSKPYISKVLPLLLYCFRTCLVLHLCDCAQKNIYFNELGLFFHPRCLR